MTTVWRHHLRPAAPERPTALHGMGITCMAPSRRTPNTRLLRSSHASRARPGLAATAGHAAGVSYHADRDHPSDRGGRGRAEDPACGASARRERPTGRGGRGPLVRGEHGRERRLDRAGDGRLCRCRARGRGGRAARPAGPEDRVRPGPRAPRGAGAHRRRARADPGPGGDAPYPRGHGVLAARRPTRGSRVVQLEQRADRRGYAGGPAARGGTRPLADLPVEWAVTATGPAGVAEIDPQGTFVAETPGIYTVTATLGERTADAMVRVEQRRVTRGISVLAHVPIKYRTAEGWVHPAGKCFYMSTIADRVYAFDISDVTHPRIVDSMVTDARIVNDVMTTEDGKYGVFSREGASNRKNGIVVFDASDACHPKPIAEYTETVSGGVHSSYVYQGRAYITDDATGSMRVIDIRDPSHPKEVARWQAQQTEAGRYLHDIMVKDGLAYLAYWNDGLIILDVGNGRKGGSPESPQLVSQYKYDLNATYARVEQLWGAGFVRGTHTAWREGKYVFVGDEVYAARPYKGLVDGNNLTFGRMHVIDVSDIEHPSEVAWYEPTDGGVHNVWVVGDTLYLGNYQGGARVLDVSGELKGDLLRQGREISWILTADSTGHRPHTPFAWGAVVRDGNILVPDINSGLWILKLEPKTEATP